MGGEADGHLCLHVTALFPGGAAKWLQVRGSGGMRV